MSNTVYIDGHSGTTRLRIRDWLAERSDFELLTLPEELRKDPAARREMIRSAEVSVLCLPDEAAREAEEWAEGSSARLLDASTAHRVSEGWVFGLPELEPGRRERIADADRVSICGCYSAAFLLLMRPLLDAGLVARSAPITMHALSGYSGGGRPMIEKWEDPATGLGKLCFEAPYSLDRVHKHIPEMVAYSNLEQEPQFEPAVGPFRCGMRAQIPIHAELQNAGASGKTLWEALHERYRGEPFVRVLPIAEPLPSDEYSFDPRGCNETNRIDLRVLPHPSGHALLIAVLDNLGKGASGNAIQCLNLMLGHAETTGLPG